ncbi:MAG TPA: FtsQ-type POTRA domain-containing protein [Microbacterium sp.]|nr:FtsQ-type POTRA domain-containing protein [Microbacterium sp.]
MRRPTPLPTPPARESSATREPPAPASPPPKQPEEPPVAREAAPSPVEPVGSDAGGRTERDAAPVRLRDVWSAARARRRALRAEVRRFTVRSRRRRAIWIGVAASLAVLVLGTLGAAYSPLFAVERITVVGAQTLDVAEVEAALADQVGRPLPLVDDSAVKEALVRFPLIETYSLEARPPHGLVLRIVERTPVGVIESAAGYTLVDAAGVALSTTQKRPDGQPVIDVRGGTQTPAFEAVGLVMRALPDALRPQVTAVRATSPDDVTLTLGETRTTIVWGGADDSSKKAVVLEKLMASQPPDQVDLYDVSSPEAVVVG